jgi:hypothetical protein
MEAVALATVVEISRQESSVGPPKPTADGLAESRILPIGVGRTD